MHRRHQLAMTMQHTLGAEDQQRVVERTRARVLTFVHSNSDVGAVLRAGLDQPIDQWPTDVDTRCPHPFPELVAARRPGRRLRRPGPTRIEGYETFREDHEGCATIGCIAEQLNRPVDRGVRVQDHGRRLHCRYPHRLEHSHESRVNAHDQAPDETTDSFGFEAQEMGRHKRQAFDRGRGRVGSRLRHRRHSWSRRRHQLRVHHRRADDRGWLRASERLHLWSITLWPSSCSSGATPAPNATGNANYGDAEHAPPRRVSSAIGDRAGQQDALASCGLLRCVRPGAPGRHADSLIEGHPREPEAGREHKPCEWFASFPNHRGGRPRQDSNLRTRLRRPMLYPLSYEGGGCRLLGRKPASRADHGSRAGALRPLEARGRLHERFERGCGAPKPDVGRVRLCFEPRYAAS